MFDDGTDPITALAHLEKIVRESGATRRVPRLMRSCSTWYVLRLDSLSSGYAAHPTETWAHAIALWCRLVRDEAQGMLGRGKCASNVVAAILRPPTAARPDARAALAATGAAPH
jgi:hypothetical protein